MSENLSRKKNIENTLSGKLLQILTGICAAFIPLLFRNYLLIVLIAFSITIITFVLVYKNYLSALDNSEKKSWGLFFFSLSFLILAILFFQHSPWIITSSFLIFSFSNFFSTFAGNRLAKSFFQITSDKKSIIGSLTFFITSVLIIISFSSSIYSEITGMKLELNTYLLLSAVIISVILTGFKTISSFGFDNFIIPLAAAFLVYILLGNPNNQLLFNFIFGAFLSLIVAVVSYRVKFLTLSGSMATFLLAAFIFGFGGWKWSIPIMAFFILSSVLSKVRKKVNENVETYFEKSGVRDHIQVAANGGIGGLLVILNLIYPNELFYFIYISSLAAVCADTWATEIGTLYKTKTYNILNLEPIEQGVSGGISFIGTFGGVAGALVIACSAIVWIKFNFVYYFLFVVLAGIFGSLFDSFLGATIQAQFECKVCGKITEKIIHCEKNTFHKRGYNWLNNDLVNLAAGIAGGVFIILFKDYLL